jgi:hypothetical protein
MNSAGVGSAVYDKITNVVTWKADKVVAGTEALIRITMMQGSEEPLSINVQVRLLALLHVHSVCAMPSVAARHARHSGSQNFREVHGADESRLWSLNSFTFIL